MARYESAIKPAGQLKKPKKTSKQTTTCHTDWGNCMLREYALSKLFTDGNLFPEYVDTKTGKTFEIPILYLSAENSKYLYLIHSYFSKLIDVSSGLALYFSQAHPWDLIL